MSTPHYEAEYQKGQYNLRRTQEGESGGQGMHEAHETNWTATAAGAVIALWGVKRAMVPGVLAAAVGGGLIYYGLTGRNVASKLWGRMMEEGRPEGTPSYEHDQADPAEQRPRDQVEEASMESFPASDSPGR